MNKSILLLLSLLLAGPAMAQNRYITDSFTVPLRTGQGTEYRILAELESGTALQVLEQNEDSGYSRIRTARGTEGWILTRYLQTEAPARDLLTQAQTRIARLTDTNATLASDKSESDQLSDSLESENAELKMLSEQLNEELAHVRQISGNTLAINQRNQELNEENQQLKNQVDLLTAQNQRFEEDTRTNFFLYGAGTIFFGILLGLIIPSMRPKRKDSGWI